jgi:hypothetical protein
MPVKLALALALLTACNQTQPAPSKGSAATTATTGSAASSSSSSPADDPCANVGEAVKSIWDRQVADATDPQVKQAAQTMGDKAVARLQRHCRDDHWSPEVISCVRSGSSTCTNKMTPDQAQKLAGDKLE